MTQTPPLMQNPPQRASTDFRDTVQLTSDERLNLIASIPSVMTSFNAANAEPIIDAIPASGSAGFDGGVVMRMNDATGFLLGWIEFDFDFSNNRGTGFVSNVVIDGDPDEGYIVTQGVLNVDVPSVTGPTFSGRILGEIFEIGNINSPGDSHRLDATFDSAFVESPGTPDSVEMVGNITGTLTSNLAGTRSVSGVLNTEQGF